MHAYFQGLYLSNIKIESFQTHKYGPNGKSQN